MDLRQAIVFEDLTPIEVEVKVEGKDYRLREATGEASGKFRNASIRSAKMIDGRVVGIDGVSEAEITLVSHCLFSPNDKGVFIVPVPPRVIGAWPAKLLKS